MIDLFGSGDELRLVVRRSSRCISLPHRHFGGGREPLVYGVARLFWYRAFSWCIAAPGMLSMVLLGHLAPHYRFLLPPTDDEQHTLPQERHQYVSPTAQAWPANMGTERRVPYNLVVRRYWKRLIGTCGAWFLSVSLIRISRP